MHRNKEWRIRTIKKEFLRSHFASRTRIHHCGSGNNTQKDGAHLPPLRHTRSSPGGRKQSVRPWIAFFEQKRIRWL